MSTFSVPVVRIADDPIDHPNADRLSLMKIFGYTVIANKVDGEHRYKKGDYVVYVSEAGIVPEYLLRQGFWDEGKNKGMLAGSNGDRVKPIKLRSIFSNGIMFPLDHDESGWVLANRDGEKQVFEDGDDAAGFLGISKYEPPIPMGMSGEVANLFGVPHKYDFENLERVPDIFEDGEEVEASEKIHGSFCQVGYIPGLNHHECFFGGNVYVCSKGLGAQGLVFKDNEANDRNLYVLSLRAMLDNGLGERLEAIGKPVRIFAEIFGQGVQDLGYGQKKPSVRVFDIKIGDRFLGRDEFTATAEQLGLETVPVLYRGPFNLETLTKYRDGKDTISGTHVREGIVIRSIAERDHFVHGRVIAKMVSPDYHLRKGTQTEYQ